MFNNLRKLCTTHLEKWGKALVNLDKTARPEDEAVKPMVTEAIGDALMLRLPVVVPMSKVATVVESTSQSSVGGASSK